MFKEKVFKIISQVMNVPFEEVNERSSSENLEKWDSFQHMNLILALEEEFKIKFTDEEIINMGNAGIILEALQNKDVKV
ncbi:MAG: acyl carrier protein [bacterium]|nr:MAG: acyl carrier protein [bacterium]